MIYRKFILVLFFCCAHFCSFSQSKSEYYNNRFSLQYGFSIKATVELGYRSQEPIPFYRLTFNSGVGSTWLGQWGYPSFNLELQMYNGGIGSKNQIHERHNKTDFDIIGAFSMTGGWYNNLRNINSMRLPGDLEPLYYFSDFVYPALKNPYDYSLTVGTNFIIPVNEDKELQRVGFINLHVKNVQVSYYNDGGPVISDLLMGDGWDRYYTGGGLLSYHGKANASVNLIELSYKKFTGFTRNAFELSNDLNLSYMSYHDPVQRYYNKSIWSLNMANANKGWGVKISSYNRIDLDLQHYIHWGIYNSYHMVPYNSYWTLSGSYYNLQSKIGLQ